MEKENLDSEEDLSPTGLMENTMESMTEPPEGRTDQQSHSDESLHP